MRIVKEILKQKGPHHNFINENATVLKAAAVMKSKNISYLIVKKPAVCRHHLRAGLRIQAYSA